MDQQDIPTYILITVIGVVILAGFLLFSLASGYQRFAVRGDGPHGQVAEPARNAQPATPATAGSMAERQQNIEELLKRKERESQDS